MESKYEDIIKQLQGELESMHTLVKERTTALAQTQARLEMCLNNDKSQVVQIMKFGAVELTQNELELISAELVRNGNGIYIPHFLYVYIQMRSTTHES